jgi:hypothetical protein
MKRKGAHSVAIDSIWMDFAEMLDWKRCRGNNDDFCSFKAQSTSNPSSKHDKVVSISWMLTQETFSSKLSLDISSCQLFQLWKISINLGETSVPSMQIEKWQKWSFPLNVARMFQCFPRFVKFQCCNASRHLTDYHRLTRNILSALYSQLHCLPAVPLPSSACTSQDICGEMEARTEECSAPCRAILKWAFDEANKKLKSTKCSHNTGMLFKCWNYMLFKHSG